MATPGNPNGPVVFYDDEVPRSFTARAREVISGGEFVFVSGATGIISSGTSSIADGDIKVALVASNERFNGIALQNAASGADLAIATRGTYLLRCGGSVFGGMLVETIADSVAVQSLSSGAVPSGYHVGIMAAKIIGRAQCDGASGGFALIAINA